jgi:hypothetical protein
MKAAASTTALLALLAAGCVPDFDTDLSRLTEPRLLAISSSPAEAPAEKEVTLTALVAVPEGTSAPRLDWTMCLARKPLTELGPVNPACLEPARGDGNVVELGEGLSVTTVIDKDVCKLFGPLRPSPMGGEGAGRPADPDVTGGFYQPFAARLGDTLSLAAVRIDCDLADVNRDDVIDYRKRYRSNENPRLTSVSWRDVDRVLEAEAPLEVRAGTKLSLRARWDECSTDSSCGDGLCTAFEDQTTCAEDCTGQLRGCSGSEPYVWYNRQTERVEPRREGITVAWFASRGGFRNEQTGVDEAQAAGTSYSDNVYDVGNEPGSATIWLVIRDSRGGQSWEIRHLEVTP